MFFLGVSQREIFFDITFNYQVRFATVTDIRLLHLGTFALFSECKFNASGPKFFENIDHACIMCLMFKLLTTSKLGHVLPNEFDRDSARLLNELMNKTARENVQPKFLSRGVFGCAENKENCSYG